MSKLALGTVQFGLDYGITNKLGQVPFNEVSAILNYAKNNNISSIDTAFGYGNSEQILGKIGVDDFKVVTKTAPFDNNPKKVLRLFYESLKHLKIDKLDVSVIIALIS